MKRKEAIAIVENVFSEYEKKHDEDLRIHKDLALAKMDESAMIALAKVWRRLQKKGKEKVIHGQAAIER